MSHFALVLLAVSALPPSGTLITYQGEVAPVGEDHTVGEAEKTFDLTVLVEGDEPGETTCHWVIDERGRGAWPWLERFGQVSFDAESHNASGGVAPALLYDWGDDESVIELAPLLLAAPEPLAEGVSWKSGEVTFEVGAAKTLDNRDVWPVAVSNNYGWKYELAVDQDTGVLVNLRQRVFMGQGDEYELRLRTLGVDQLATADFEKTRDGFTAVREYRDQLARPARTKHDRWTSATLEQLASLIPAFEEQTTSTVLAPLVRTAKQSLTSQNRQADLVAEITEKQLGREMEAFKLLDLNRQEVSDKSLDGAVTVLHFWSYRDTPLKEPYGQVGYLDFLYERHHQKGLKVYGVAVDGRFNDEATRATAERGVRKLREFMHISYPILLDGGELIGQFGDPRLIGAELPLYVVIDREGRVQHYHVGMHAIDRNRGLNELDDFVVEALSKESAK